jgi:hypothetical protein
MHPNRVSTVIVFADLHSCCAAHLSGPLHFPVLCDILQVNLGVCYQVKTGLAGQAVWQYRWPSMATGVFSGVIMEPLSM